MTELFGTLFPLNNILSHIKLIPPLGRDFIMQKTLIHCCWVYLGWALMKPPPSRPPPLFLRVQQALVRQSTRDRDNKMQLEAQQKEGFIHWSGEKRCCWRQNGENIKGRAKEDKFTHKCQHFWWRNLSLLTPRVLLLGVEGAAPLISCIALYLRATFDPAVKSPGWYDERKLWVFF